MGGRKGMDKVPVLIVVVVLALLVLLAITGLLKISMAEILGSMKTLFGLKDVVANLTASILACIPRLRTKQGWSRG